MPLPEDGRVPGDIGATPALTSQLVKTLAVLAALAGMLAAGAGCSGVRKLPGVGDYAQVLPEDNPSAGLRAKDRPRSWTDAKAEAYLDPEQLRWYQVYGLQAVSVAEYTFGPQAQPLTIEAVTMRRPLGAAGVYHWVRNTKLGGVAEPLMDVPGVDGVVDRRRGAGNVYFYKRNVFYKILYNGPRPAPDLTAVARLAAGRVDEYSRPLRAFGWMAAPGVDMNTAGVTPGPAMQCEDLPMAAFARAPGAGERATIYVIECETRDKAADIAKAHQKFLRLNSTDQGRTTTDKGRREVWWAVDHRKTPVIATTRGSAVLLVANADSNRVGGELLDRVAARVAP